MIYVLIFLGGSLLYSQCNDYNESNCSNDDNCEWIEDIANMSCSGFTIEACNMQDECFLNQDCTQWGSWYSWICYDYGPLYCSGSYELDNSYCQEIEMPECSEMNDFECSDDNNCEWIEDIIIGDCSDIINSSECYQTNQCSWYNAGPYGYWYDNCYGGTYEIDNSYCEETAYQLGDINQDEIINIQDVIIAINLILNGEFDLIADINFDSAVNVLDIIQLVNIILNN